MVKGFNSNYILVMIFLFFLVFLAYIQRQNRLLDEKYTTVGSPTSIKKSKPILITQESYRNSNPSNFNTEIAPRPIEPENSITLQQILSERSVEALENFKAEAFIDLKPPETFDYHTLDLDDKMAGIFGYDPVTKAKVTGIAYADDIASDKVIDLLKTNSDYLPNLSDTKILNVGRELKLPAPEKDSGFNSGSMWNGKLANGEEFAAIFLPRQDKKGVYFLMLTGSPSYFESNDGAFDPLYENVKALPAPKP